MVLAENGRAEYVVVQPETPTAIDAFAIKELAAFLKKATGAEFKVVPPDRTADSRKRIFVGLSAPALKILGNDPLAGMTNQEHVARNIGADVFLYGQGPHGNLYAVYEFLETSVGCRWFSAFGRMKIPQHPSLRLQAFNRRVQPAFPYRYLGAYNFFLRPDAAFFLYRNRLNLSVQRIAQGETGVVDAVSLSDPGCHTLFAYIPPQEKPRHGINPPLEYLKNKNYYKTNPDFFSMDSKNKRVDTLQLCFSNPELRRTLTENVVDHVKLKGGRGIFTVDANDGPGHFCQCPECIKLEQQYASIGGPLYDYLLELSSLLQTNYPDVSIKFLAYRKEQSQKPPKIAKLPDNLIVIFAPIDDNFAADWKHPSNSATYRDLEQWCKLARNVWVWYYPNPYVGNLPFGNIERLVNDIRLMKKAGCNGTFFEHDVGVTEGFGFSELQTYLMLKLWQDPDQDANALITEFMEFQYGKAAPMMRQYLDHLEKCRKEMNFFISWNPTFYQFRYLTPDNLFHWEQDFDQMEQATAQAPEQRTNVQMTRVNLDMAVLRKWPQVKKAYPDYFKDIKGVENRVRAAFDKAEKTRCSPAVQSYMQARRKGLESDLNAIRLFAENPGKPLPEQFAGIAKDRIRRAVPRNGRTGRTNDSDAAFGVAGAETVHSVTEEKPFTFGFYDEYNKKFVLQRSLKLSEIKPDVYQFYKLGKVELTPSCLVWLGSSWLLSVKLDEFYEPGVLNQWEIYASMKFEGPSYSKDTQLKEDCVLSDQIVLIKAGP